MRKSILIILLLASGALPAFAADDVPTIAVTGTAVTEIVPDELVWNVQVRAEGQELPDVAAVHTEQVAAVLRFLEKAGIAEDDMSPSRMSCGENWTHDRGRRTRDGYYAATRIAFRSRDLDAYVRLWTGLVALDGVSIQAVGYDRSDRIRLQEETRREALRAARAKAADLAAVLGATIAEPLQIVENPDRGLRPLAANTMLKAEGDAGAAGAAPGRIEIQMAIDVVFRLVPEP